MGAGPRGSRQVWSSVQKSCLGESGAQTSLCLARDCLFWSISVFLLSTCAVWEGIGHMMCRIYALYQSSFNVSIVDFWCEKKVYLPCTLGLPKSNSWCKARCMSVIFISLQPLLVSFKLGSNVRHLVRCKGHLNKAVVDLQQLTLGNFTSLAGGGGDDCQELENQCFQPLQDWKQKLSVCWKARNPSALFCVS